MLTTTWKEYLYVLVIKGSCHDSVRHVIAAISQDDWKLCSIVTWDSSLSIVALVEITQQEVLALLLHYYMSTS